MSIAPLKNSSFFRNIKHLGFEDGDDALFIIAQQDFASPTIRFHLELAKEFQADAIYVRKQLNVGYKTQLYFYDFTNEYCDVHSEEKIAKIQKKIWSSGEVPLACIVFNTEIRIVNCTTHITKDFKPKYLVDMLQIADEVHTLYNTNFANQIKTGIFWEKNELKNEIQFHKYSAYNALISNIQKVREILCGELKGKNVPEKLIVKILIQSILIKYLEERIDSNGGKLLTNTYFKKYQGAHSFNEVLQKRGCFGSLLKDLDKRFKGNVFKWEQEEHEQLKSLELDVLARLLETNQVDLFSPQLEFDWRYFEFKYIPVELISRLYETFLGENRQDKGLYYTPSHLAKLLVDESIPLNKYTDIDLKNYTVLDPSCGSGIFLVVVFKRLVQIWRLKNDMRHPSIDDLKMLIKSLYGVDREEQAVQLASFSLILALCDELEPIKIINELEFDDLRANNLIYHDFFTCKDKLKDIKFDLIIGNPPFKRAGIANYTNIWEIENKKIEIPVGQIALKFLFESFKNLKDNGLICLIIKSSGLLYNSTSTNYKKQLFFSYDVVQIFDFTALAEGKSLWDNGARVGSSAIFIRNRRPDFKNNILHLIFKRTKTMKNRIIFEIDDGDIFYVSRQSAMLDPDVWKMNLLGGGRIGRIVSKMKTSQTLIDYLTDNNCIIEEGFEMGSKKIKTPSYIYDIPFLPTNAISENGINYKLLTTMNGKEQFSRLPEKIAFFAPNIIIWESIGENQFPIFFNTISFSFKRRCISIKSRSDDIAILNSIIKSFERHYLFYKFYILVTSSEMLVNRNQTFLLRDIKRLPFVKHDDNPFDETEIEIMRDTIFCSQNFLIHGEKSSALTIIEKNNIESVIINYAEKFVNSLNIVYRTNKRKFRLSHRIIFKDGLLGVVFKYDNKDADIRNHENVLLADINIEGLVWAKISPALDTTRTIRLYPQRDTIVLIKPNQYRYWLSSVAYRDADKCMSSFAKAGY